MARKDTTPAVVAIAATAALATPDAAPPPEEGERVEGRLVDPDVLVSKIAELNTELDEFRRRTVELEAALIEARSDLRIQREEFSAAWSAREAEIAALPRARVADALPPHAPVRGKIVRARCMILCRAADGSPLTVAAGSEIPAGADLTGVSPEALSEESAR